MLADKEIRLEEAKNYIEKALEIEPDNFAFIDSYGWVLYRLGKLKKAEIKLKQSIALYDGDPVVFEHLGDVLWARGKTKEAKEIWQKALELGGNSERLSGKLEQ